MAEKDYGHRSVVDKLGITPGTIVAFAPPASQIDDSLREQVLVRSGRPVAEAYERPDVVLSVVDRATDAVSELKRWKQRLEPAGGIWLLTPKRGQPGHLNQNELIDAGKTVGLVDNKVCSFSDVVSGMRFVIRKEDRVHRAG